MSEIINGANMNRSGAYPGWQAMSAIDEAAAAAKTEVTVTQVQTSTNGTKIATIGVDDVNTDIYTPAVSVTQVQGSTDATKIATVGVGAASTDIYTPTVSVTQVQGSTGATKIATVGVGSTSTDIYAPGKGDLVIELHYVNEDSASQSQTTVTVSETPATVLTAIQAGKEIKAKLFYANNDPQYEYPLMLNGFMAIANEYDEVYYPEIDFSFIYNDDGSAVSDNDFLAKVMITQDGESWTAPMVYKYDLQEFTTQG